MKASHALIALAASTLLFACGSEKKTSANQPDPIKKSFLHVDFNNGFCSEWSQKDLNSKGLIGGGDLKEGRCPSSIVIEGETVTPYAYCPRVDEMGLLQTSVIYGKTLDSDGAVFDMSLIAKKQLCKDLALPQE